MVDTLAVIGYEAYAAGSAKEALAVLSREQIGLVISDINMPEMSGIELLQEIKQKDGRLPVMLITGIGSETIKDRAYASGADGFLAKPFRIGTIEAEINKLLTGVKRRRIALIDDNEEFLQTLSHRLEEHDNIVYTFKTVKETMCFLDDHAVDLVITDLKMPDGDGLSLIEYLRRMYPQLPVVMVSAYATEEIVRKIQRVGVNRFFAKPINFNELDSVVESIGIP